MSSNGHGTTASAFSLTRRPDGLAILSLDVPGEPVNMLQANFAEELGHLLEELEAMDGIRALVLVSGKPDTFIAGADIKMLQDVTTAGQAAELSRSGQRVLNRLAELRVPTVAAIHGACLGGGLEVALACRARVASNDAKTKLGLPEVQLGLLPGLGGTQRLPRLIGAQAALDLMLTGKQLDAKRAAKLGLVDEVVAPSILREVAFERALRLAERGAKKPPALKRALGFFSGENLQEFALTENPLGRKLLFDQAKKQLLAKTHGNYPAPERILEVVQRGLAQGFERGLEAEARAFGELVVSAEAAQLMNIFFATQELKKDRGSADPNASARPVTKVGMIGAGLMGAGIAYVTADLAKVPVRLRDRDDAGLASGLRYVRGILDERVKRRRLTPTERDNVLMRIGATTDYSGFSDAEVVIEAVFEDLALKHLILKNVEEHGHPEAIFASNTSSLPISRIAEAARNPERVIGMHYFSPVHKMPLLEIIVTPRTAPWVTATSVELGKKQGKTVIVVNDGVGFYTSRILSPYMNEAAYLLSEGVPVEAIDRALVEWGFPVGPLTLLDEVGIDVGEKVGKIMHQAFGERLRPPPGTHLLVESGRLGRKNKKGLYLYDEKGKKSGKVVDSSVYQVLGVKPSLDLPSNEIAQRCVLQMVNEAALCFGEGILRSARDGDIGAVFGLGFPPFRGGPFRYVDMVGASEIVRRLESYERRLGTRFKPAKVLVELAERGGAFYGSSAAAPGGAAAVAAGSSPS